ncbi:Hypothetical predicted protein [Paramuricea clavata]|uniref:Uncharacterized protein n=1 Tax=Paramuricea clavata TaxID=317549 RepID=A0A6S7IXN7_PARCT|nr:Hypothetical predicted protein [Paramuricea clavata]
MDSEFSDSEDEFEQTVTSLPAAQEKQRNDSQPSGVKRKISTDDSDNQPGNKQWWLQPRPSKLNKGSSSNISTNDKTKWGICVTCFRTGESPKLYQLCRSNKTSIKRHAERRHDNNLSQADVRSYYDSDETVRMARKKYEAQQSIGHPKKVDTVVRVQSAPNVSEGSTLSKSPEETISGGQLKTYLPEKVQTKLSFNASCSEEQSSVKQGELTTDASLHAKVDTLINEFKEFKIKSLGNEKDRRPNSILAVDGKSAEETAELLLQWPDVKISLTW